MGEDKYRDSKRMTIDDPETSDYIMTKSKDKMPLAYEGAILSAINRKLKFLKYDHEGAKFGKHCDVQYSPHEYAQS